MTIKEFLQIEKDFNEAMFINKADNVFVKLFTAIMLDELDDIRHFVSEEVYKFYKNINEIFSKKNQRQMYDELNVKSSKITSITKTNDSYVIEVYLEARYMDYIIDLDSGNKISGCDDRRIQENYILRFVRKVKVESQEIVRRCSGCGAPMDINNDGKCNYCGVIYSLENYDWILDSINKK